MYTPNFSDLVNLDDLSRFNLSTNESYSLVPRTNSDWKTSRRRLMVVVQTVASGDLKQRLLLASLTFRSTLKNLLGISWEAAQTYADENPDIKYLQRDKFPFSFCVVNFNAAPTFSLSQRERSRMNGQFAERCKNIIGALQPTHLLVLGDEAFSYLMPHVKDSTFKRGWVLPMKNPVEGKPDILVTPTLDIDYLISAGEVKSKKKGLSVAEEREEQEDEDDEDAGFDASSGGDLLYYVSRNITNLLVGKNLHDISYTKPKPLYVDTIEAFDEMMGMLKKHNGPIAFDSETANLESYRNKLYFVQFATHPKEGYVVPIEHPKTPFTKEEVTHIKKRLRALFSSRYNIKQFVTMNGSFDLRVLRAQLSIPFIFHKFWDITAGEALLDENVGIMTRTKIGGRKLDSLENLAACCCYYNDDWYKTAPFSKEDRNTAGYLDPNDKNLLNYASKDVQVLLAILKEQWSRAKRIMVENPLNPEEEISYLKPYKRIVSKQMNASIVGISHLTQFGSHVDINYLKLLQSPQSPLLQSLKKVNAASRNIASILKVNKKLLPDSGITSAGLFGASAAP